ncbi:hypothetical protein GJU43_12675 [Flavobacterium sp. LC2016-23]|uniref:hypothetical protein n=1 Tax=Flavobacterium sp. LC2016-23 TaxID=2666330 RepID=UPI0012AF9264|nr:hypothetical protein [Flavobacterium sp. LC2016-23]MRX40134.1 hypothetical protein [Flavobacterium sp. LC2016-23]
MNYKEGVKSIAPYKSRAEVSQQREFEKYRRFHESLLGVSSEELPNKIAEFEEKQLNAIPEPDESLENPWYGGSVDVKFGVVYGRINAIITFKDGDYQFDTSFWGFGAAGVTAGGGGPWGDNWNSPGDLKMGFEVFTASYGGGILQVFWIYNGQIVGSFVGPAIGAGAIGGGGTGKWKKL